MELLRLRKRKVLAQRGHSLLEDKMEKLILEYHRLIREFKEASKDFEVTFNRFFEAFIFLKAQMSPRGLERLLESIEPLEVRIDTRRLLNLNLPLFYFEEQEPRYSPIQAPPQWDRVFLLKEPLWRVLFKLTQIYVAIEKTSGEILKTRRRVNALEYILIPTIDTTIKSITQKLNEIEREFLSQISRIKDLIRR
jgi:V/A-type H+-transporting ATPase subunit D